MSSPCLRTSIAMLLLLEGACQTRHASIPAPPPPTHPAASEPVQAPPAAASPASARQPGAPIPETSPYQVNKPPQPSSARKTRPAPAAPTPSGASEPVGSPAPPTPAPKLGDVLTADEQRQYSAAIDQSLSRAQSSLDSIANRKLNQDQQAQAGQIRSFIAQARSRRGSDPAGAKSLAERAEVLARDLAAAFR